MKTRPFHNVVLSRLLVISTASTAAVAAATRCAQDVAEIKVPANEALNVQTAFQQKIREVGDFSNDGISGDLKKQLITTLRSGLDGITAQITDYRAAGELPAINGQGAAKKPVSRLDTARA